VMHGTSLSPKTTNETVYYIRICFDLLSVILKRRTGGFRR